MSPGASRRTLADRGRRGCGYFFFTGVSVATMEAELRRTVAQGDQSGAARADHHVGLLRRALEGDLGDVRRDRLSELGPA